MEKIFTHKEMLDLGNNHNSFLKQYLTSAVWVAAGGSIVSGSGIIQ